MKNLVLIFIFLASLLGFSQDNDQKKLKSIIFIDLNATNKSSIEFYNYKTSINGKGSIALEYNIDFKILKKLSITGIASLINYNDNPRFGSIKVGSGFKLVYGNHNYHYLTLQYGYHIPFNKNDFREGHQLRVGQVFDVAEVFNKRLLLGLNYTLDLFDMKNTPPHSNGDNPIYLRANSYGISLGLKF